MTSWRILACLVAAAALWPGRGREWLGLQGSTSARESTSTLGAGSAQDPVSTQGPTPDAVPSAAAHLRPRRATPALEVAATIDLIVLCLAGGRGVVEAVDGVARSSAESVRQRLATVVAAVRWGVPWAQAWGLAGAEWRRVGTAFALAEQLGVAPTAPLVRAASDLRVAARHEAGLAAARLGVRLVLPLGLTFLPAFVLLTVVPLVVALASHMLGP